MEPDRSLREHLVKLLEARSAHLNFDDVLSDFPEDFRGVRPPGAPYSPWQLLEHMRLAQVDILDFSRNPGHVSPEWPEGYWPSVEYPPDPEAWERSVRSFSEDLRAMQQLVTDMHHDLFEPIPHGTGQTLLREALVVADHNAYHLGQLSLLKQLAAGD